MIHVVKRKEAKHRNSFGVAFDLLAIGPQSMVTKMHSQKKIETPFNPHPMERTAKIPSLASLCLHATHDTNWVPTTPTPSRRTSSTASRSLRTRRRSRCSRRHGKISADTH